MAAPPSSAAPTRRTWDVEEYAQRARDREKEERERAKENEERQRKGLKPLRRRVELPMATKELQARDKDLEISKNEGKTLMVDSVPGGRKGPGFYCETCNRTFKDSIAYLDHVNGRLRELLISVSCFQNCLTQYADQGIEPPSSMCYSPYPENPTTDLRKLGQTTQVSRSTLEQVRTRLEHWREEFAQQQAAGNPSGRGKREYDFETRLAEIAKQQQAEKELRRQKRKDERAAKKQMRAGGGGADGAEGGSSNGGVDAEAMAMMGFGSFGSSKKR